MFLKFHVEPTWFGEFDDHVCALLGTPVLRAAMKMKDKEFFFYMGNQEGMCEKFHQVSAPKLLVSSIARDAERQGLS